MALIAWASNFQQQKQNNQHWEDNNRFFQDAIGTIAFNGLIVKLNLSGISESEIVSFYAPSWKWYLVYFPTKIFIFDLEHLIKQYASSSVPSFWAEIELSLEMLSYHKTSIESLLKLTIDDNHFLLFVWFCQLEW